MGMKWEIPKIFEIPSFQRFGWSRIVHFDANIKELKDLEGNIMEQHSKRSNEIYHFSIYSWKFQRDYIAAMYLLRKSRFCALRFGPKAECLMADDDFYRAKRRKLNRRICR